MLVHNVLQGTIPSELSHLQYLENLYLDHNALQGTIPSELSNVKFLLYVQLQSNKLTLGALPCLSRSELHVDCSEVSDLSCLEESCATCAFDDREGCTDDSACSDDNPVKGCLHCIGKLVCA